MIHTTKQGAKIPISQLETNHLTNIIAHIERRAHEGVTVRSGGGTQPDDMWYDEDTLYGEDVLRYLNYYAYKSELSKRLML